MLSVSCNLFNVLRRQSANWSTLLSNVVHMSSRVLTRNLGSFSLTTSDAYTEDFGENGDHVGESGQPSFGLLFDIDGVVARGLNPLPEAKKMFDLLKGSDGKLKVPVAFVTNACSLSHQKAEKLSEWFDIDLDSKQVILSPSPLSCFKHFHEKRVLFVGQEDTREIAAELGFKNVVLLEEIIKAYPCLDVVCHMTRKKLAAGYVNQPIDDIDAIVLIGEPVNWESNLQILIDLLVTNGKLSECPDKYPIHHLPILACNLDLVFMAEANLPRIAHGAFLLCLESLYQKITGNVLDYTAIIGKPSEITYRYAEHTISWQAKKMGYNQPIRRLYFFGDNPAVDILGANLYNNYLKRYRRLSGNKPNSPELRQRLRRQASMADSRIVPEKAEFLPQTVKQIDSILVQTGVYKPNDMEKRDKPSYCHRDFVQAAEMDNPSMEVKDCLEGIKQILYMERYIAANH